MNKIEIKNFDEKVDAIRKLFNEPHSSKFDLFDRGMDQGILSTLEILDIKIEGVNDKDYPS